MSSIAPTATPTIRKRGPPAPLNLAPQPFPKSQTIIATSNCEDSAVPEPLPVPQPDEQGATSSAPRPALHEQQKPAGSRNVKRLSLSITGSIPPQPAAAPSVAPSSSSQPTGLQPQPPRRHSVASLPGASASTILRRNDEGDTDASAYLDGPIEVMPGIWLGSEDNARDWSTLVKRGIRSILNVAKEVTISFDSPAANQPRRNVTSVPNLHAQVRNNGTYQPAHLPSGRPAMHYLKLSWSHGQPDLVRSGFAEGMAFVDQALARKEGVLVHCQCGVSRSATMVIALVMRAAAQGGSQVSPDVLALRGRGMQAAYDYVQKKSNSIGPNMSLIYQLLDYERALKGGESPTASSKAASEDEEWERRRMELDSPNQESDEILKEAQAMDREMEERRARRLSAASNTSSTSSFTGSVGNGAPWRMRYGPGVYGRSRAASMESSVTSRSSISVLSEDPLEEEDEDEADPTKVTTPDTDATDEDTHQFGLTEKQSALYLRDVQTRRATQPPSAPPTKTSFYHQPPPPTASAFQTSFMTSQTRHTTKRPHSMFVGTSPSVTASTSNAGERPTKREKRRPPPLANLNPSVPFPSIHIVPDQDAGQSSQTSSTSIGVVSTPTTSSSSSSRNRRLSARILSLVPFPLKAAASSESLSSKTPSAALPTPTATQTLFVFPPSPRTRGASTPSTLTLISTPLLTPSFGSIQTPRAGLFRSRTDSRKSWIGLSAVTPTTATARVDARGMFEA